MTSYPLHLNLKDRLCVVIGGGRVAARKISGLLAAGARVRAVAPDFTGSIEDSAEKNRLELVRMNYDPSSLEGVELVFAATSDPEVNRKAADDSKVRGIWVNVADDPAGSDFHMPAVFRTGEVVASFGTSGSSPAMAAWLRDEYADALPEGVASAATICAELRDRGFRDPMPFRNLMDSGIVYDLSSRDLAGAMEKVVRCFGISSETAGELSVFREGT